MKKGWKESIRMKGEIEETTDQRSKDGKRKEKVKPQRRNDKRRGDTFKSVKREREGPSENGSV